MIASWGPPPSPEGLGSDGNTHAQTQELHGAAMAKWVQLSPRGCAPEPGMDTVVLGGTELAICACSLTAGGPPIPESTSLPLPIAQHPHHPAPTHLPRLLP